VSTGADISSAPTIEQSVMISGRGRARVVILVEHEYVAPLEAYVALMVVDMVCLIKDLCNESTAEGITTSLRSVGRSLVDLSGHN